MIRGRASKLDLVAAPSRCDFGGLCSYSTAVYRVTSGGRDSTARRSLALPAFGCGFATLNPAIQTAKYAKYAKGKGVKLTRSFTRWVNRSSSPTCSAFACFAYSAVPTAFSNEKKLRRRLELRPFYRQAFNVLLGQHEMEQAHRSAWRLPFATLNHVERAQMNRLFKSALLTGVFAISLIGSANSMMAQQEQPDRPGRG